LVVVGHWHLADTEKARVKVCELAEKIALQLQIAAL